MTGGRFFNIQGMIQINIYSCACISSEYIGYHSIQKVVEVDGFSTSKAAVYADLDSYIQKIYGRMFHIIASSVISSLHVSA